MADGDFNVKAIISAQTSQFEKGMKNAQSALQKTSKSIEGVSKLLKSAFSIVGIGASISAIKSFGQECVKSADSANKSLKILNNTLKVTGANAWTTSEDLVKMSEEIAHSTNYTVGEIQDMQSVLLGFKNITGDTFRDASNAITDMATVMGMDLKSAVQTVGKALDDPIKGLDSLRRQGFAFTEEQKQELEVLVKNGKQLEAQKVILDELNTTYGGAAKSAQSSFDKQKDSIIEFRETVGNKLIPVMEVLAEKSANTFNQLSKTIEKIDFSEIAASIEYVVDLTKEFLRIFYDNIKKLFEKIEIQLDFSSENFEIWKDNLFNILDSVYKIVQNAFGFIEALIDGNWEAMWEYAKLVVLRFLDVLSSSVFQGMREKLQQTLTVLKALPFIPTEIKAPLEGAIKAVDKVIEKAGEGAEKVKEEIKETEEKIVELTGHTANVSLRSLESVDSRRKKYLKDAKNGELELADTTSAVISEKESKWKKFFDSIKTDWAKVIEDLKEEVKNWQNFMKSTIKSMTGSFNTLFTNLGENFVEGAKGAQYYVGVVLEGLAEVLKALGAELSARAMVALLTKQYADAAKGAAAAAAALAAGGIFSALATDMKDTETKIEDTSEALEDFNKNTEITIEKLHELKDALAGVISGSTGHVSEFISTMTSYKSIAKGLKENIDALQEPLQQAKVQMEAVRDIGLKAKAEYDQMSGLKKAIQGIPLAMQIETYNVALAKYDSLLNEVEDAQKQYEEALRQIDEYLDNSVEKLKANNDALQESIDSYREFFAMASESNKYMQVLVEEQRESIKNSVLGTYNELTKTGEKIGSTIFDSIKKGATKTDFLSAMKEYARENLLKLAVYTDSFSNKLAEIGAKLSKAISGQGSVKELRKEMELLYEEASQSATKAEKIISEAFGDIADSVNSGVSSVENGLTRLGKAIQNFKETVSDVGNDIASELINGLSEGLTQGDFLSNMKKWLKKMLVQATVYTESMKAEIEAIGKAITKGITEGFSATSLHEIKRDLSWVFENANNTISNIDRILDNTFSGYASGTDNASSGLHLVGEAGPELIRFRGGEKVYNNQQTNKILGNGVGSTFNVTFNNLQDTSAYVMMNQLKQYNRQMAINGIV